MKESSSVRILPVDESGIAPRRSETWARLAHRVSAFFGVDLGEAPAGQTWLAEYNNLTSAEIARGGLLPSREWHERVHGEWLAAHKGGKIALGDSPLLPKNTFWIAGHALIRGTGGGEPALRDAVHVTEGIHEIAPATTGRFGPDRKAALVLAGANEAFASLLPVFHDVIGTILSRQPELQFRVKITLWASLVLEAYRSQPCLFAASAQARAIQRALSLPWAPASIVEPIARSEFGSTDGQSSGQDPDLEPRELNVLDRTLKACLGDERDPYMRDELVSRWVRHLLESPDRGVVWVTETAPGRREAEVLLSTVDSIRSFLETTEQPESYESDHWSTLCPVAPDKDEIAWMPQKSRQALIWSLVQTYRILRDDPKIEDEDFRRHVTEQMAKAAALSAAVLGPAHPLTYFAANRHALAQQRDLRQDDPKASIEAGLEVNRTAARLSELQHAGMVSGAFYAEVLVASSAAIRLSMADAEASGQHELATEIQNDLRWLWDSVFSTVGVDLDRELENARHGQTSTLLAALSPHVHNYARFLCDLDDIQAKERALVLMESVVIPAREGLARARKTERPLRLSLQVAVQVIDALLTAGQHPPETQKNWAKQAWEYTHRLIRMPYVQETLANQQSLTTSRAAALTAVVRGWLVALENEVGDSDVSLGQVREQIEKLARFNSVDLNRPLPSPASEALLTVERLHTRLLNIGVVAEALSVLARANFIADIPILSAEPPSPAATDAATADLRLALVRGEKDERDRHSSDELQWTHEMSDPETFIALRGTPRRHIDRWPALRLRWTGSGEGTIQVSMVQPFISPSVASVTATITLGDATYQVPLTWEDEPGQIVELQGSVTGVPKPSVNQSQVEVVVHGRTK
jgi:hypothetical protein